MWHWRNIYQVPSPKSSQPPLWSFPKDSVRAPSEPTPRLQRYVVFREDRLWHWHYRAGPDRSPLQTLASEEPGKPLPPLLLPTPTQPGPGSFQGVLPDKRWALSSSGLLQPHPPSSLHPAARCLPEGVRDFTGWMRNGGAQRCTHSSKVTWRVSSGLPFTSSRPVCAPSCVPVPRLWPELWKGGQA